MPGAYPKEWLDTKAKRDIFWNVRLGTITAFVPALVTGMMLQPNVILGAGVGTLVWVACLTWVFRHNIFGRLMGRFKWLNDED